MTSTTRIAAALLLFVFAQPHAGLAQTSLAGDTLHITRATGSIKIDGNLSDEGWQGVTLFIQRVSSVRGTYTFTSRMFLRGTAQYVSTNSDPSLYTVSTLPKSGTVSGQILLSHKLNWQSVMFASYGDDRMLSTQVDRQFFVKLSYALQR